MEKEVEEAEAEEVITSGNWRGKRNVSRCEGRTEMSTLAVVQRRREAHVTNS
jgi:hypothetical protein